MSIQCLEERKLKENIRKNYCNSIPNYVIDVIIHMSENEFESKRILEVLKKYKTYSTNKFLRKGEENILGEKVFENPRLPEFFEEFGEER